ncbi:hypothetical protein A2690_01555 [Candidatus Roizmanbacteria bacterium RIFCSPHIGHO2_01_FULL_39_12b]|uniref:Putative phage metallopeptidase domain-containing protein n=1 Tax=Candidatus Roizmanbacteria bacterium RIFCSPHIGHO2_01_FULL_39_12b TaxID=1802030 RepID=A0A1F7G7N6_9BACT|nr:MAG: hypothetical protein A2690_01555 [Candidatus Roizmanbacteria bacterium RIFCSPHIGHO2_01_FULL_39_12b]OGK45856.1 MAG: hypothetical protein A3B46_03590 [Candidatus Roizmanbacteria bacterium RIFCSPLOWO2_01_FULL_39_19]
MFKKKRSLPLGFEDAPDVVKLAKHILHHGHFEHINLSQTFFVRSRNSKTRAYARVWGLSRIFQVAAGYKPTYVVEVLSQYFDKLNDKEKIKVLIHEFMHIPKTFSGALLSHRGPHHRINHKTVDDIYEKFIK